jgi:hypothetical protein
LDLPVRAGSPAIAVDEEAEVGVVEKKFAVQALDVDGFDVFLSGDEVQGGVGLVEEGLTFGGFKGDDFKALGASDAKG